MRQRLQLGTRSEIGTREIPIPQVIGSAGRAHEFDGCFRPRSKRLRDVLIQIKTARPDAADLPILAYQVDHAYFVVDGHKRMSLAIEEGRQEIDAEVTRFASRFHVAGGTTIEEVRATEREHRFRQITALDVAVPDARFPLGNADDYLDLEESVKAHAYDLSRETETLVPAAEAAKHWYDLVYRPVVQIALKSGVAGLFSSSSEAELFLLLRRGSRGRMDPGWRIPDEFVELSRTRLREAAPGRLPTALARATRRERRKPRILPEGDISDGEPRPEKES